MNEEMAEVLAYNAKCLKDRENVDSLTAEVARLKEELAAANEWKLRVIDELVTSWALLPEHDTDPLKAVKAAIEANVKLALDPAVSSDAQALIDRGAASAREELAAAKAEIDGLWKGSVTLLTERDEAIEWADKLAADIAEVHDLEIGEHSNGNNPWDNAWNHVNAEEE